MNAPRADANKSMAEVEKTVVSLSGVLTSFYDLNNAGLTALMPFMFNVVMVRDNLSGLWFCMNLMIPMLTPGHVKMLFMNGRKPQDKLTGLTCFPR